MSKKIKLIIGGVVTLSVIVGGILIVNSESFQISSKMSKIEEISEQHKNGQIETSIAIEELRRVKDSIEDKGVKDDIQEKMNELSKYHNGRVTLDETREAIDNNIIKKNGYGKEGKEYYIAKIERYIDEDSELYEESQKILSELGGYKQKYINITSTSLYHDYGTDELKIRIENQSGKDIEYIRIDIFEKENGKVINSEWTNSSALIVNGGTSYIETYFDFQSSESEVEFEISDIRYR